MSAVCTFVVVDKPAGVTSHDIVAAVRAVTGVKKVGHTGTLDPFATGVLPLALGRATRLIQYLDESLKIYDATISFGAAMDTGDPTGEVTREAPLPTATESEVLQLLESMVGEQLQTPPPYSAVKVKGKPLYYYARKGIEVQVAPRPITIHRLELQHYDAETMQVRIHCSRGTYARVLADDIATALGSAGHLGALSRVRSGPFTLEGSLTMPVLAEQVAAEPGHDWQQVLLARGARTERVPWRSRPEVFEALRPYVVRPLDALSHLPLVDCPAGLVDRVKNGAARPPPAPGVPVGGRYLVLDGAAPLCLVEHQQSQDKILVQL